MTWVIWLFVVAWILDAFSVLSRSAIIAFSLADMEERLRKQDRIQKELPRFEAFTEFSRDVAFTFLLLTQISKAVVAVCLFIFIQANWPELNIFAQSLVSLLGFCLFLFVSDSLIRPIASEKAEAVTHYLLGSWKCMHVLMYIPALPFRMLNNTITSVLTSGEDKQEEEHAEDEIIAAVAFGEAQGHILEEEREMIEAVLEFRDKTVADVMSPRTDMAASDMEEGTSGALDTAKETGHSRLPIYSGNRDNIVGILYVKDLIGIPLDELPPLDDVLRPPVLVPSSKSLASLLAEMRRDRVHLAVVLDEFGGTAGLVSIEDIFEEVFGEIEDEYDADREEEVRQLDQATYDLDARMKVEEVNERFDFNLPLNDNYESLGGLVTSYLGCIPKPGEVWNSEEGSYTITVLEATPRRVVRVCVERHSEEEQDSEDQRTRTAVS